MMSNTPAASVSEVLQDPFTEKRRGSASTSRNSSVVHCSSGVVVDGASSPATDIPTRKFDEDVEDDWDAEARKPTREKGIQWTDWPEWEEAPDRILRYRRMVWERPARSGRWYGRWTWVETQDASSLIEEDRELAIATWKATEIPTEIFLGIARCLVGGPIPDRDIWDELLNEDACNFGSSNAWRARDLRGLSNLALVCRAWFALIAPLLYSKIVAKDESVEALLGLSRTPHSHIRTHAKSLELYGPRPWAASARLGDFLGGIFRLRWTVPQDCSDPPCYHPTQYRTLVRAYSIYSNVIILTLERCRFLSTLDLLSLLASLPSLTTVVVTDVKVTHVSRIIPTKRSSRLRIISFTAVEYATIVPGLAGAFSWSHTPYRDTFVPGGFAGLSKVETSIVILVLGLVKYVDFDCPELSITEATMHHPWVVWLCSITSHVEFHVDQIRDSHADKAHQASAHISRVVLRFVGANVEEQFIGGLDGLRKVDAYFSQLPLLQSVIFETNAPTRCTDAAATAFRNVGEERVYQRTCEDAHRLAVKAKGLVKNTGGSFSARVAPLSPFWYLRRHAGEWTDWLPSSYWESLAPADRAGWSP